MERSRSDSRRDALALGSGIRSVRAAGAFSIPSSLEADAALELASALLPPQPPATDERMAALVRALAHDLAEALRRTDRT